MDTDLTGARVAEGAKATRDALRLVLTASAAQVVVLGLNFLLRGQLGPEGMGYMALAFLALTYSSYIGFGVLQAAEREIPIRLGAGDREGAERLEAAALAISLVTAVVIGIGLAVAAVAGDGGHNWLPVFTGVVCGALLVIQQPVLLGVVRLRTRLRFKELATANAAISIGSVSLPVVGALVWGVPGALSGVLAASVLAAAGLMRLTHSRMPPPTAAALASLTRLGPGFLASNLAIVLLLSIDQLAIGFLLGTTSLGLYSAALLGRNLLLALPTMVGSVVYPRLQLELGVTSEPRAVYALAHRTTALLAVAVPLIAGIAIIVLPPLVVAVLPRYAAAADSLRVLLASAGTLALGIPASSYLITVNRQWHEASISLLALVVAIVVGGFLARDALDLLDVAIAMAVGATFHGIAMQLRAATLAKLPIRSVARAAFTHLIPIAAVLAVGLVAGRLAPGWVAQHATAVAALQLAVLFATLIPLAYLFLRSDTELRSDLALVAATLRHARW